jgi:HPr kinase/phosphorylase
VGIINARRIFGIGAVKITEKIDMIVKLEQWNSQKVYDRLGLEDEYMEVLGIKVPVTTVPVKPGRNLAIIIETAARNNRQKKMGYSAAKELMASLGMAEEEDGEENVLEVWH